ncbi:CLOCK-interacting pacemaker [Danio rerio]|uniref:CLOCK-interacting pacemaker n=1 Tax=Danio rerio TaxID=7955 RepID=A0A2R9YJG4_DANRE|nr:CLOCK-interacting pacemaker-like [Danio rerio]|eukprot:XP_005170287.1 CLOCK-interacting pacemaker-like [Danio rerio]
MKGEAHLRAMGRFKNRRMEKSKKDSERDSGFSDSSAVDQTDADDDSRPHTSQLTAVVGGALQGLQPMIIMNNVVLNQPSESSASLKPWFSPAVEVLQQPQVVFLQPVVPQRSSNTPKTQLSKRRRHKKYLPILKSYARIAPHPHKSSTSSSVSSSSSTSSIRSSASNPTEHRQTDATPPVASVHPQNTPADGAKDTECMLASQTAECTLASQSTERTLASKSTECTLAAQSTLAIPLHSETESKTKRFCNTYNILSKSGLLDITLRTKELIRQNRRTQTELDRLRKHTELFLEALQTGDAEIWSRLQTDMETHTSS